MIALGFQLLSVAFGLAIGAGLSDNPSAYTVWVFVVALAGLILVLLGKERRNEVS